MQVLKTINLLIAFLLEVIMLVALGIVGFEITNASPLKYILAVALPTVAIIVWAIWAAPKSKTRLSGKWLLMFKLLIFSITSLLLYYTGHAVFAIVFGSSAWINTFLLSDDYKTKAPASN